MKNSRRLIAFLLCLVLTLTTVVIAASASVNTLSSATSKYYQPLYVNGVETGALYTQQILSTGNKYSGSSTYKTVVNSVEVPAGSSSITIEAINGGSYTYSKATIGSTVLSYNSSHSGETVVAAMNADPWIMYHTDYDGDGYKSTGSSVKNVSMTRGMLIIDGELWATAQCDNENLLAASDGSASAERGTEASSMTFAVTNSNTYLIGCPKFYITVGNKTLSTSTGTTFSSKSNAGVNRLPAPNSLIIYNQRTGTSSQAYSDAYEIYLDTSATGGSGSSAIKIGSTVTGVVTKIYASGDTSTRDAIGANTIVLSARGTAISSIQGMFTVGQVASIDVTPYTDVSGHTSSNLSVWSTVREAVGGWWETVKNGVVAGQLSSSAMYPAPMIGIKQDGTAVMMAVSTTVDGVRSGVRNKNLGDIALDLGCYNAIVFDGGGSVFMATLEGSTYVRRTSAVDGTNSVRAVINGLAAVYHGADLTATYSLSGTQKYLSTSIEPSTTTTTSSYNNMSYIEYINGTRVSGLTSYPATPKTTTLASTAIGSNTLSSPYTLTLQGWSIVDGGTNGGIHYSLDGGTTWAGTTPISYSTAEEAVLSAVQQSASFSNISGTNGRFQVSVDLSSYVGKSVDITFAIASAGGTFSKFLTLEDVQVGTVTADTAEGDITWKYSFYSTVEAVQGTVTSLVGYRDTSYSTSMTDAEKLACLKPATGSGFTAPSKTLSISGWAIVNGGVGNNGNIYWSTDKSNWTACTNATISNATSANLTTAKTNGGVNAGSITNAAFTNATADLSSYDGDTVTVYFATTTANSDYIHFLTLENVAVGSAVDSGSSGGGSSSAPSVDTGLKNSSDINVINGIGVSGFRATAGNPFSMDLPSSAAMTSYTFSFSGWSVSETGTNGGINYSLDGGNSWYPTTGANYQEAPTDGSAIVGIANTEGLTSASQKYARFDGASIDLSGYAGKTVNITIGINTSSTTAAISTIGTFTNVAVPTASYNNGAISLNKINNVDCTFGNVTAASGVVSTSLPSGCGMSSTSFTIHGWAIVDGQSTSQNCMYVSVDGGTTWIQMTGTYDNLSDRQDIYNAIYNNSAAYGLTDYDVYAAFSQGISADLSAYAGFTVDVTIGVAQADGNKRPLATFTGVTVPGSHTHTYKYTSTGNGTHTVTCTSTGCSYSETVLCTGDGTWYTDGTYHWQKCSICSAEVTSTKGAHTGTATCTAAATCTVCSQTFGEVADHTIVEIAGQDPTCTETGWSIGEQCSVCKEIITPRTELAATGHTEVVIPAVAATCTSTGLSEGKRCLICSYVIEEQTVTEKTGHTYVDDVCSVCGETKCEHANVLEYPAADPTCTESGYTASKVCKDCGEILLEQTTVPATGHTEETISGKAATCTEDGLSDGKKCSVCGAITVAQKKIDKLGHTEQVVKGTEATCSATGLSDGKICSVCGYIIEAQTVTEKKAHTEQIITGTAATCTEDGLSDSVICSVCKTVITEATTTPKTGHNYKTYTYNNDATCTAAGTETALCDRGCGTTNTIPSTTNPALGHDWVDATCTVAKTCSRCKTTEGSPLGHSFTNYVSNGDATCQADGTKTATCDRCTEKSTVTDTGSKTDHKFTNYISNNNATCTADGTKTATCDYEGCNETDTVTDTNSKTGHNYATAWSYDETHHWHACTNSDCIDKSEYAEHDVSSGTCECGYGCKHTTTVDVDEVPATCTTAGTTAGKKCSACGTITEGCTEVPATGHTEAAIGVAKEATCTEDGITEGVKCSICETVIEAQQTITAIGHDEIKHEAQASTCQEKGWNAYETCSRCDYTTYKELELAAHKYTTYTSNNDATCQKNATETASCDYGCKTTVTRDIANSTVDHEYENGACKWCGTIKAIDVNAAIDLINGKTAPAYSGDNWPIKGTKPLVFSYAQYYGNGNASAVLNLKFWGIATGGQTLAYNINGGSWADFTTGLYDRNDVVAAFPDQGFVATNAGFDGTIDLTGYVGQTVSIGLAVKTVNGDYVTVAIINDYTIQRKFVSSIDYINGASAGLGGNTHSGIIKHNAGSLSGTTLNIVGWTLIDGGQQNRLAWSVNGGQTWNDITSGLSTAEQEVINAAAGAGLGAATWSGENGRFNSTIYLSAYAAQTVTVSFAGRATDGTPVIFAEITVTVPGGSPCTHNVTTWTALGDGTHYGYCTVCSVKVTGTCEAGTTLGHDEINHWTQCTACGGAVVKTAHSGGTATCTTQASCEICGRSYGELNASNHTGKLSWTYTETTHTGTYSCCNATVTGDHSMSGDTCGICGYIAHEHNYTETVSDDTLKSAATCTSPAIYYKSCSICGVLSSETFTNGDKDATNHAGTLTWAYTETTHTQTCGDCGATVVEGEHTYSSIADTTCNDCGYVRELAVKWSGFIDMINYCGPNGTSNYGDAGKITHKNASWSTRLTTSLPDSTLAIKGWLIVEGGHDGYVYSVNGGKTWLDASGAYNNGGSAHIAVAESDGIEDAYINGICFETLNIDLSDYKGQTVNEVKVGFKKGDERVCFATITNVAVPAERWAANIGTIDTAVDAFGGQTGSQINGLLNIFHATTLSKTTMDVDGWMLIDGGQTGISWSVDGGKTWNVLSDSSQATFESPADLSTYIETANSEAGTGSAWSSTDAVFHLHIDLSAYVGKTVTVTLARTVASNPTTSVIFAKVNVTVPGTPDHICSAGEGTWTFNNNGTHSSYCTTCGIEIKQACTASEAYTTDANGHWKTCTVCGGVQTYAPHDISNNATCDEGKICSDCGYVAAEPTTCTPGPEATCTNAQVCTVCGKILNEKLPHTLVDVDAKKATCAEDGYSAHERCEVCGYETEHETYPRGEHTRPTEYDCTVGCFCTVCNTLLEEAKAEHTPSVENATCSEAQVCLVCQTVLAEKTAHTPDRENATCTLPKVCKVCNEIIETATGHDEGKWTTVLEATCVDDGQENRNCTKCGELLETRVKAATGEHTGGTATCESGPICTVCSKEYGTALGHNDVTHAAQEATCYQIGWNEYVVCERCGRSTYVEIAKKEHNIKFVYQQEPTCTETGLTSYEYCLNDGCTYSTKSSAEEIAATGHKYDNVCGRGLTCNVCGATRDDNKLPDHTEGVKATCTSLAICKVCGQSYGEVDATNHTGSLVYVAINGETHQQKYTCCDAWYGEAANHTGETSCSTTCTVCGGTRDESTLEHKWSTSWSSDATNHYYACENAGCEAKKDVTTHTYANICDDIDCDVCGYIRPTSELKDHAVGEDGTAATCTAAAVCGACGKSFGSPLGHELGDAATCTTAQICTRCKAILTPALGHKWSDSYTTDGDYHWYTCENGCGEITGKEAHDYSKGTCVCGKACPHADKDTLAKVAPTCTETGLEACLQCKACGALFDTDGESITQRVVIAALGHSFTDYKSNGNATCTKDGTKTASCDHGCGATETLDDVDSALGHNYGDVPTTTVNATCTVDGYKIYTCTVCAEGTEGHTKTETIKAEGHKYAERVIIEAGCESTGLKKYMCSVCDAEDPDTKAETIEALGHEYTKYISTVDPTCETAGYEVYQCIRCDKTENRTNDSLKAKGHTKVTVDGKAATCTEDGYTEGIQCSVCKTWITAPTTIPAGNHQWDESEVTKAPTCTEQGTKKYTCSKCGETKKEVMDMIAHETEYGTNESQHWVKCKNCSYTEERNAHTWDKGVCTVCEYACKHSGGQATCIALAVCDLCGQEYGSYAEHVYVKVDGYAAECEKPGLTDGEQCNVCKKWQTEQTVIPALGHSYTNYVYNGDATCTAAGTETALCDNGCGTKKTITSTEHPATGHSWGTDENAGWSQTKAPTCTEAGQEERTCSNCSTTETHTIDALGHDKADDVEWTVKDPATCTDKGLQVKICTKCNKEILASQDIPATGHSWKDDSEAGWTQTKAPTCTEKGEETRVCTNTGCTVTQTRDVDALGHDDVNKLDWVEKTPASCEGVGEQVKICSKCKAEIATEEIKAKGHDFSGDPTMTVDATCTEDGYKLFTCKNGCGETMTETIKAKGHTEVEIPAVEATCTKHGLTAGKKCSVCDTVTVAQEETALAAHTPETVEGYAATCTATGLSSGKKCSVCEAVLEAQTVIPMIDHTLGIDVDGKAATCLDTGREAAKKCSVCQKMFSLDGEEITAQKVLPALGHNHEKVETVAPTCTAAGYELWKCERCEDSYHDNETSALGHDWGSDGHCTRCGIENNTCEHVWEYECSTTCSKCGLTRAASHSYETLEGKSATCTETGLEECKRCIYCQVLFDTNGNVLVDDDENPVTEQKVIPALGHDEVEHEAKAPTCTAIGWEAYVTCTRCDYTTYKELDALGHTEVEDEAIAATCTTSGKTAGTHCSVCNTVIIAQQTIEALGHDYGDVPTTTENATCTVNGYKIFTCTACTEETEGHTKKETIEATGHNWVSSTVPPTCETKGYTQKVCSACLETGEKTDETEATGHVETYWMISKNATCAEAGSKYEVCKKCNKATGNVEAIAKSAHNYSITVVTPATCENGGYTTHKCAVCGDCYTDTETTALGHDTVEVITKPATCKDTGLKNVICTTCGKTVQTGVEIAVSTEHKYNSAITAPTCTENGYTTYTCKVCGDSYTDNTVTATGHKASEWIIDKDATCTSDGAKHTECTVCKAEISTETIKATGHSYKVDKTGSKDATCTEDGYILYVCTVCAEGAEGHTKTEPVAKTGCESGGWKITKNATCTEDGSKVEVCKNCGKPMGEEQKIEATGHNYQTVIVKSTCTVKGTETKTCTVCNDVVKTEIELAPHVSGGWKITENATCTAAGSQDEICTNCGAVMSTKAIEALGHTWVAFTHEATCTTDGESGETCSVCGDKQNTIVITAKHVSGGWVIDTPATCTTAGSKHEICKNCGGQIGKSVSIDATGHSCKDVVTAPTCTANGYTTHICTNTGCTYSYTDTPVEATDHSNYVWVTDSDSTCMATGTQHQVCGTCGETIEGTENTTIDKKDHNYKDIVTAPTCDDGGYTTHTCTVCGDSYTDTPVGATGHTESDWIIDTAATCTVGGERHTVCTVCSKEISRETTGANGHSWGEEMVIAPICGEAKDGYTLKTCTACGEQDKSNTVAWSHTLDTDEARAATCTAPGLTEGEHCSVCGKVTKEQESVAKAAHDYNDDDHKCKVCGSIDPDFIGHTHEYAGCNGETCIIEGCDYKRVAPGHLEVIVAGKAATCTSTGLTAGKKCSVCGETTVEQSVIPQLEHDPSLKDESGKATATCTEDSICKACGEVLVRAITVHGSKTHEEVVDEATCTAAGYKCDICELCGEVVGSYKVILATGHTNSEDWIVSVEATCGRDGVKHIVCTVCNAVLNSETIPANGEHTGGKATCAAKAECDVCGQSYGELSEIHTPGDEATCTSPQICKECHKVLNGALGHTYDDGTVEVEATCVQSGTMLYTCTVCNAEKRETIEATGEHTPDIEEPTCTASQVCTVCDRVIKPATGHTGGKATCMTLAVCDTCGASYGKVDANAHTYDNACDSYCNECGAYRAPTHNEETVKGYDAKCEATGLTDGVKCADCGEWITEQETIPATGHNYVKGVCSGCCKAVCGSTESNVDHTYDNCEDAICNVCGYERVAPGHAYRYVCSVKCIECGYTREDAEHTWSGDCDDTCNVCGYERETEHTYEYACSDRCSICGAENTNAAKHTPTGVTCLSYGKCSVCGIDLTDGTKAAHTYTKCNAFCDVCGETRKVEHKAGSKLESDKNGHWYECTICGGKVTFEAHTYDNGCDTTCNVDGCGYVRKTEHVKGTSYENDENGHWYACTICGGKVDVAEHVYDSACDKSCNACGYTRTVGEHVYDNDCDATCNNEGCGYVRSITHVYDNDCDTTCNVDGCGYERTAADHIYFGCDERCAVCGATRVVEHTYEYKYDEYAHWNECTECGKVTELADHKYSSCEDKKCSVCAYERSSAKHDYGDDECNTTCNICGKVRKVDHDYAYPCSMICRKCGAFRSSDDVESLHTLAPNCVTLKCQYCDYETDGPGHTYLADCATECSVCHEKRENTTPHTYKADCSEKCDECEETRVPTIEHEWGADCSLICKVCGTQRELPAGVQHTYEFKCSRYCSACGYERPESEITDDDHTWGDWVCTDPDKHWRICANCGEAINSSKKPHSLSKYVCNNDGTHTVVCINGCGYTKIVECNYVDGKCVDCNGVQTLATSIVYALPEMTNSVSAPAVSSSGDDSDKDDDTSSESENG